MQDQNKSAIAAGDATAQPATSDHAASSEHAPASPVKDPRRLHGSARLLVILFLGISVISAGSYGLELAFLDRVETSYFSSDAEILAAADANDFRQVIVSVTFVVIFTLTYIFVGRWIYFSSKNVRAFGAVGLTIRPGWAVGWYFIPIANLWKPYQAMKEIWQASSEPLDWARQKTPGLLPVWWSLWVIMNVYAQVSARLSIYAENIADFKIAAISGIAGGALNIVLCVVFLKLIGQISRLQIEAMESNAMVAVF